MFLLKDDFDNLIKKLNTYCDSNNVKGIQKLLKDNVAGYKPSEEVDWISNFDKQFYKNKII